MIVFELTHIFYEYDGEFFASPKGLGVFDSFNSAQSAIQHYKLQPGFCDNPNAFSIRRRKVIGTVYNNIIYEAMLNIHSDDYEFDYGVELGYFGSEEDANSALDVYCNENPTFVTFERLVADKVVNKIPIGRRDWSEGFDFD